MGKTTPAPGTTMPESSNNTSAKVENDGQRRMPHERDEAPDAQDLRPRGVMKQAASDIERGLVDTDLHDQPGVEKVGTPAPRPATAQPLPDRDRG